MTGHKVTARAGWAERNMDGGGGMELFSPNWVGHRTFLVHMDGL